eukprot:Nk52_evm15s311 gene=Nk52_evmTU15s311
MASGEQSLTPLYAEVDRYILARKYDKVVPVCEKILSISSDEAEAIKCAVVAYVFSDMFKEALAFMSKYQSKIGSSLAFEKAYCQYRMHKLEDALKTIRENQGEEDKFRFRELEAQVLYRMENWTKCIDIYGNLRKESNDNSVERETNLSAVIAMLGQKDLNGALNIKSKMKLGGEEPSSFEMCYNAACLEIHMGNLKAAEKILLEAQEICKQTLEEEDFSEEEIESELAVMKVQMALVYQLNGKTEEALEMYNSVLKTKPSDGAMAAVASNNVVVIHKARDVFDSKKKMKVATSEGLENKLTSHQRRVIALNQCLLYFYMNQAEQCRELASSLQNRFKDSDFPTLILASLLYREKKHEESIAMLESYAKSHPNACSRVLLTLTQNHLKDGNYDSAVKLLSSIPELKHRLGVVAVRVALYERLGKSDDACKVLDEALSHLESKSGKVTSGSLAHALMKESAHFRLKHGFYKEAAALFEKLVRTDKKDKRALAGLIMATSHFDPKLAEQYASSLPAVKTKKLDADELEKFNAPVARKDSTLKSGPKAVEKNAVDLKKLANKKKKKRKNKEPKNGKDGKADPERWIPKWERSYFRKLKKKNMSMKGSQGASANVAQGNTNYVDKKSSDNQGAQSAKPVQSMGVSSHAKNKQKKKKKGKW